MNIGVVVIGRNEGERLQKCLESVRNIADQVVYVDSNSTDGSVVMALGMGLGVVSLDLSTPFTAARARNEGFKKLLELVPDLSYVQFVDGDCEIVDGWLETSTAFMNQYSDVVMVCGRLRERNPGQSIYNLLCDIEWNTPVGESKACGGIAMVRVKSFKDADGYRANLIAGEEPELCVRLRASGWHIWRLDTEMALHDAAMICFGQWWKRSLRAGYAFAEGTLLHGAPPERHYVQESRRAWFWGLLLPALGLLLAWISWVYGLIVLIAYLLQISRLALRNKYRNNPHPWAIAFFMVLGKLPEMMGQVKFIYQRLIGNPSKLIEYK